MKKLLLIGLFAAFAYSASAEEVTVNFTGSVQNGKVNTLPDGWDKLIVGSTGGTWESYADGTIETSSSQYNTTILITPKIMSTLQFQMGAYDDGYGDDYDWGYYSSGTIKIYNMKKNDAGEWEKDGEYLKSFSSTNITSYDALSYDTGIDGKYIGFELSTASLHSVTYMPYDPNAEITKLSVTDATLGEGYSSFSQNEEGMVPYSFNVTIENTGNVALNPGDANYTFNIKASNIILATVDIPEGIAPGETKQFNLTGEFGLQPLIDAGKTPNSSGAYYLQFVISENVSNSEKAIPGWKDLYPYTLSYQVRYKNSDISDQTVSFGMVAEDGITETIDLRNRGGRPLVVTALTLPEGFTTDQVFPFTVAPVNMTDNTATVNVSVDPAASGLLSGDAWFTIEGDENPVTFTLTATKVAPGMYLETFEDQKAQGWTEYKLSISQVDYRVTGDENSYVLGSELVNAEDPAYGITPKLSAEEGDLLTFDAAMRSTYQQAAFMKVYVSADREEWTLLKSIVHPNVASEGEESFVISGVNAVLSPFNVPMVAGENYYKFEMGYVYLDNVLGGTKIEVPYDLNITNLAFPSIGIINNRYEGYATIKNINDAAIEADSYEVSLLQDGEVVSQAEVTPIIPAGEEVNITLGFTPHSQGTHTYSVRFSTGDYIVESNTISAEIAEESFEGKAIVGVGNKTSCGSGANIAPMNTYYKKSLTHQIYTEAQLAASGITPGSVLTGISYDGLSYDSQRILSGPAKVWIESTELSELTTDEAPSSLSDENLAYSNPSYTLPSNASSSNETPSELVVWMFNTPYEYNGGNILISTAVEFSTWSSSCSFLVDPTITNQTIAYGTDSGELSSPNYSQGKGFTQTNFLYESQPTYFQGTVKDNTTQESISDAVITLTSGEVIYTGNSDESGNYSIPVVQNTREYELTVTKDGYNNYTSEAPVTFEDGTTTMDILLTSQTETGITSAVADSVSLTIENDIIRLNGIDNARISILSINGLEMGREEGTSINIANIAKGVYILRVETEQGNTTVRFMKH